MCKFQQGNKFKTMSCVTQSEALCANATEVHIFTILRYMLTTENYIYPRLNILKLLTLPLNQISLSAFEEQTYLIVWCMVQVEEMPGDFQGQQPLYVLIYLQKLLSQEVSVEGRREESSYWNCKIYFSYILVFLVFLCSVSGQRLLFKNFDCC